MIQILIFKFLISTKINDFYQRLDSKALNKRDMYINFECINNYDKHYNPLLEG